MACGPVGLSLHTYQLHDPDRTTCMALVAMLSFGTLYVLLHKLFCVIAVVGSTVSLIPYTSPQ